MRVVQASATYRTRHADLARRVAFATVDAHELLAEQPVVR